ncbi:MAG TPA: hypothetical protein V6C65_33305 [Allocoleopsis sp.]
MRVADFKQLIEVVKEYQEVKQQLRLLTLERSAGITIGSKHILMTESMRAAVEEAFNQQLNKLNRSAMSLGLYNLDTESDDLNYLDRSNL